MLPPSWAGLAACPWGPVDPLPTHLESWETQEVRAGPG